VAEKALAAIRQEVREAKAGGGKSQWAAHANHSTLVENLHVGRRPRAAWKEAKLGGCTGSLWMLLAAKREKDHPEEALPIYQREVESILGHASNDAYVQAVKLLKKIGQ
jgi:hypothetical protein